MALEMPMPGAGGPPGGMPGAPPVPHGPPGGTGPAAAPHAMLGQGAQAMTQLKIGLEALNKALGGLPIGSEVSKAVHDAVVKIGKHLPGGGAGPQDPQAMIQQLALAARDAKTQPNPMAAMMGGGAGGAPPAPPVPPPAGA